MSDRIDPRRQTREIREALGRYEPEQLLDILTHVFRQYVVDGSAPPPMQLQDELSSLSFAQVIERLQLRLDLPELRLFEVQAGRVMVRVDGRLYPLETAEGRQEPLPVQRVVTVQPMTPAAPPAAPPASPAQSPSNESRDAAQAPGVHSVGHASAARPQPAAAPPRATPAAAPAAAQAARPAPTTARPAAAQPAAPSAPATAPAAPARPEKAQPEKNDSPGGRFGLLEID